MKAHQSRCITIKKRIYGLKNQDVPPLKLKWFRRESGRAHDIRTPVAARGIGLWQANWQAALGMNIE